MKNVFYTLIFSLLIPFSGTAQTSTPYKGNVLVTISAPRLSDGQASYRAEIDFRKLRLSSMEWIEMTPVVSSADGARQEQFAPIIIMGKQRARIVARDQRLNGFQWPVEPSQIIVLNGRTSRRAQMEATVPYEHWMQGAGLTVVEKTFSANDKPQKYGTGLFSHIYTTNVSGSAPVLASTQTVSAPVRSETPVLGQATVPSHRSSRSRTPRRQSVPVVQAHSTPQYQEIEQVRTPVQPPVQQQQQQQSAFRPEFRIANASVSARNRTESFSGRISFAQNNTLINRTLGDNAVMLAETDAWIRTILSDPCKDIVAVKVKGFASPEGETESNRNLSTDRARSFVNYLGNVHNLRSPGVNMTATGMGEDWAGLRNLVESSTMDDRYRILDALDNFSDNYQRRAALQELNNGITYATLLNYYSALRRVEFTIEYTTQEAGAAPVERYDAVQEIRNGNYDAVIARMNTLNTPQAWNNIGVCYWCKGEYDRALEFFRRAADSGLTDAQENIRQYNLWLERRK